MKIMVKIMEMAPHLSAPTLPPHRNQLSYTYIATHVRVSYEQAMVHRCRDDATYGVQRSFVRLFREPKTWCQFDELWKSLEVGSAFGRPARAAATPEKAADCIESSRDCDRFIFDDASHIEPTYKAEAPFCGEEVS